MNGPINYIICGQLLCFSENTHFKMHQNTVYGDILGILRWNHLVEYRVGVGMSQTDRRTKAHYHKSSTSFHQMNGLQYNCMQFCYIIGICSLLFN